MFYVTVYFYGTTINDTTFVFNHRKHHLLYINSAGFIVSFREHTGELSAAESLGK